jgi:hypothetical protein
LVDDFALGVRRRQVRCRLIFKELYRSCRVQNGRNFSRVNDAELSIP